MIVVLILLLLFFSWFMLTATPYNNWEQRGRNDAIRIYNLTKVVPNPPSAEALINQGFSATYIKHYLKGFKQDIQEINEYIKTQN